MKKFNTHKVVPHGRGVLPRQMLHVLFGMQAHPGSKRLEMVVHDGAIASPVDNAQLSHYPGYLNC